MTTKTRAKRVVWTDVEKKLLGQTAAEMHLANPRLRWGEIAERAQAVLPADRRRSLTGGAPQADIKGFAMAAIKAEARKTAAALNNSVAEPAPAPIVPQVTHSVAEQEPEELDPPTTTDRVTQEVIQIGAAILAGILGHELVREKARGLVLTLLGQEPARPEDPLVGTAFASNRLLKGQKLLFVGMPDRWVDKLKARYAAQHTLAFVSHRNMNWDQLRLLADRADLAFTYSRSSGEREVKITTARCKRTSVHLYGHPVESLYQAIDFGLMAGGGDVK